MSKKPTNPAVIAEAVSRGFTVQHAHVIGDLDAALQGHDASIALPVMVSVIDTIASLLEPAAQEHVAGLLSEAAYNIAERARQAVAAATPSPQPQESLS